MNRGGGLLTRDTAPYMGGCCGRGPNTSVGGRPTKPPEDHDLHETLGLLILGLQGFLALGLGSRVYSDFTGQGSTHDLLPATFASVLATND